MLFIRASVAFLALPAIAAGLVPALIVRSATPDRHTVLIGIILLGTGCFLLLWCVRDFYIAGKGTLAPWDPPKHLVVVGLYRFVRNPMYLAVLTIVAGWSVLYVSAWMTGYLAFLSGAFHVRVCWQEEPWLRRQFGPAWETYAASTPRCLPRSRRDSDSG